MSNASTDICKEGFHRHPKSNLMTYVLSSHLTTQEKLINFLEDTSYQISHKDYEAQSTNKIKSTVNGIPK